MNVVPFEESHESALWNHSQWPPLRRRATREKLAHPSTESGSRPSSRSSLPSVTSDMCLVRLLPKLGIPEIRVTLRRILDDFSLLLALFAVPAAHSVNPDPLDAELVLAKDGVESIERLGSIHFEVKDIPEDFFERIVGEPFEVADDGEELAEGEGIGEGSVLCGAR
jgi:hypothetical protein